MRDKAHMASIDESKQFVPLNIAVLTVSDTRSLEDDKSGTTLSERLTAAGHKLAAREIVVDEVEAIRLIIKRWIADPGIAGRLPRRLGRHSRSPARLPHAALQFCGDHAAAGRTSAAPESEGGISLACHSGARVSANPESRDSPMCNCTSEVWSFGPSRNDGVDRYLGLIAVNAA